MGAVHDAPGGADQHHGLGGAGGVHVRACDGRALGGEQQGL